MIRLGVICPSEIAMRRFMPELAALEGFQFVGIGVCTEEERFGDKGSEVSEEVKKSTLKAQYQKAAQFVETYGGKIFEGYEAISTSSEIDALYIPLPPSLHFKWAKRALESNKHVLVEKPATIASETTREMVELAREKGRALHENYMFVYHDQLKAIDDIVQSGEIGDVRLYRITFGFPRRAINDFRYNKELGGGALMDAGGYTIKYAATLLGESAKIAYAQMNYIDNFEVDLFGSGAIINREGITAQIAFGMDNQYKCDLEVWGSKGCLMTGRILTAPTGFVPEITINKGSIEEVRKLPSDNTFRKSILKFQECITNSSVRENNYNEILKQAELIDEFIKTAKGSF
ncbi:Gfo/Idh/MocA family protein [Alkaliphilus transvaalensis]|uniref:Gfo/Idh/MocA family protein n=1 Tax=Alkaliphilus transvaalensis TaxID=114628 RepID=UPI000688974E|nr:Gfo/Idh/MocA family oxidoreductase [Alkaliphilus transvaalensis]